MSVTESPIPEKRSELIDIPVPMFSLNDVLRENIRSFLEKPGVVFRCEDLPFIKGSYSEFSKLFDMLINMIATQKQEASQLFLYIDCKEDTGMKPENGFRKYIIKFHTNITTSETWKQQNREILTACEKIITDHKGELQVNHILNTGCLFSISLAGKFA